jgi:hypothetical protein
MVFVDGPALEAMMSHPALKLGRAADEARWSSDKKRGTSVASREPPGFHSPPNGSRRIAVDFASKEPVEKRWDGRLVRPFPIGSSSDEASKLRFSIVCQQRFPTH